MIDLRQKGLPNTIYIEGDPFLVKTDFRDWIKFGELIKDENCRIIDLMYLFPQEIPVNKPFMPALLDFYTNPNITPKLDDSTDNTKALDYVLDGEYIVGSFMQVYGIDLTTCDMHWHLFKALFTSLPEKCKIKEIMSFRTWQKNDAKYETSMRKAREIWSFPKEETQEEKETLDELNELFYNS